MVHDVWLNHKHGQSLKRRPTAQPVTPPPPLWHHSAKDTASSVHNRQQAELAARRLTTYTLSIQCLIDRLPNFCMCMPYMPSCCCSCVPHVCCPCMCVRTHVCTRLGHKRVYVCHNGSSHAQRGPEPLQPGTTHCARWSIYHHGASSFAPGICSLNGTSMTHCPRATGVSILRGVTGLSLYHLLSHHTVM